MKGGVIYAISLVGVISISGIVVGVHRKRTKGKKDQAFGKFIEELESAKEPEKINEAVLNKAFNPAYWQEASQKGTVISEKIALEIGKSKRKLFLKH